MLFSYAIDHIQCSAQHFVTPSVNNPAHLSLFPPFSRLRHKLIQNPLHVRCVTIYGSDTIILAFPSPSRYPEETIVLLSKRIIYPMDRHNHRGEAREPLVQIIQPSIGLHRRVPSQDDSRSRRSAKVPSPPPPLPARCLADHLTWPVTRVAVTTN